MINYGQIFSRAWQITWRWKILWVLGFLIALGNGGGGGGSPSNFSDTFDSGSSNFDFPPELGALILAVICVLFVLWIVVAVVATISRGALIAGVQQIEDEGTTTLGRAWRVGVSRFWTFVGIWFLSVLPIILTAVVVAVVGVAVFVSAGIGLSSDAPEQALAVIGPLFLCLIPLVCVLVVFSVVLAQIQLYAERAAVLESLGWTAAFRRGWQILKQHIGPTVVFWLIFLVVGGIIAAIVFGGLLVAAVPLVAIFGKTDPQTWMFLPLCGGGLIAAIVFALVTSVVEVFTSSTWTLAYRALTKPAAALVSPSSSEA